MSVLVYIDHENGKVGKSSIEAVFYASKIAAEAGTDCVALALGDVDDAALAEVGAYGASKVLKATGSYNTLDSKQFADVVNSAKDNCGADWIVFAHSYVSKDVAPRLAARNNASLVVGAISIPSNNGGSWQVKRSAYSGKAFAFVDLTADMKIISLQGNTLKPEAGSGTASVEAFSADAASSLTQIEVSKNSDKISLAEASIVVSGGRGLKGPENWGMIEELAALLGAGTACSRPVSDTGWRPHSEHVGQTGKAIRPNLYFAIGISGAIQHLAGVNGSKTIVVINTDPEAPFFKAADYGIVGDAFDVVPKLIEAFRKFKAA